MTLAILFLAGVTTAVAADDDAQLLEAGTEAVAHLKPLAPGETFETYFGVFNGPDTELGYVVTTLKASADKKNPTLDYVSETNVMTLDGIRVAMILRCKFKSDFEPIEVEVKRTVMRQGADDQWSIQHAVIGPKKVKLDVKSQSNQVSIEPDRPEAPFIYGIETFVQRLDLFKYKIFALREFNIGNGAAGRLNFVLETWSDGMPTLVVREPEGEVVYQFWFTMKGELIRFGEPTHPVIYVKTTKEHVNKIKKTFGEVKAE
jgi:hypothetical protein